jgi:hypothetical protein
MDPMDVGFIKGVITFTLLAGTSLLSFRMWLSARRDSASSARRMIDDLRAENDQLRAELDGRMTELEERVDFTERRLLQDKVKPPATGTRIPTPV